LSQTELANMIAVSGASMVHMIDRWVKAGLVIREPSISDRRVNRIVITDAGHRLYAQIKDEAYAVRRQFLASVDLQSLAHLTELLEQLQCILQPYRDWIVLRLTTLRIKSDSSRRSIDIKFSHTRLFPHLSGSMFSPSNVFVPKVSGTQSDATSYHPEQDIIETHNHYSLA